MTLVCSMCKAVRGDIYRIPVSGLGDITLCSQVVECLLQIYRVVAERPQGAPVGCAA